MEDRIQVNGVWYRREDSISDDYTEQEIDVTYSMNCVFETSDWCFEGNILLSDDAESIEDYYGDPWLEITDKRSEEIGSWVKHNCDNVNWMWGVLENNSESMPDAHNMFDDEGLKLFISFLEKLIGKGWLRK